MGGQTTFSRIMTSPVSPWSPVPLASRGRARRAREDAKRVRKERAGVTVPTPAGEPAGSFAMDIPHNSSWEIK
jgi:hypothetical protein